MNQKHSQRIHTPVNRSANTTKEPLQSPSPVVDAVIVLTGERNSKSFRIYVNNKAVDLSGEAFKALIALVVAGCSTQATGYCWLSAVTISRLRDALDETLGDGFGKSLIQTGRKQQYRLTIPPERMKEQIYLRANFFELEQLGSVSSAQIEILRQHCTLSEP